MPSDQEPSRDLASSPESPKIRARIPHAGGTPWETDRLTSPPRRPQGPRSPRPCGEQMRSGARSKTGEQAWGSRARGDRVLRQLHYYLQEQSKGYYRLWKKTRDRRRSRVGNKPPRPDRRRSAGSSGFWLRGDPGLCHQQRVTRSAHSRLVTAPGLISNRWVSSLLRVLIFLRIMQSSDLLVHVPTAGSRCTCRRHGHPILDVKGQDRSRRMIGEHHILEDPKRSRRRREVPGGLLLWGPTGTGKTLMARGAGGARRPRAMSFVEPRRIKMFMGSVILKAKPCIGSPQLQRATEASSCSAKRLPGQPRNVAPRRLDDEPRGHDVDNAPQMKWDGVTSRAARHTVFGWRPHRRRCQTRLLGRRHGRRRHGDVAVALPRWTG